PSPTRRFPISVDEPGGMRGCQAPTGVDEGAHDLAPGPRRFEPAGQVRSLDELHGDEDLALVLTRLEDRDDVWMAEAGHRLRLAHQASGCLRAGDALVAKDLQRDPAVELRV